MFFAPKARASLPRYVASRRLVPGAIALLLLILGGCDTNEQQDAFAAEAGRTPSGITSVSESGEILDEDDDDWRTAPVYAGEVLIEPARPNPVPVDAFVTVPVSVRVSGEVRPPLRLEVVRDNRLQTLDEIDRASDFGAYVFTFSAAQLGTRGLHRLFIFDGGGEIVSFGDVLIQ